MWSWLWILPAHVVAFAVTAGDGTRSAGLQVWWWDLLVGPVVCGIAATALSAAIQLHHGPRWCWQVVAIGDVLAYVGRAPSGTLQLLWPTMPPVAARLAGVAVAALAVTHLVLALGAKHAVVGVVGGVLPCAYSVVTLMLCDANDDAATRRGLSDPTRDQYLRWKRAPIAPLASTTVPDPDLAAGALRPLLGQWGAAGQSIHRRTPGTAGGNGATRY